MYELYRVDRAGVPEVVSTWPTLSMALAERDRFRRKYAATVAHFCVTDADDAERGWLDWDEVDAETTSSGW